MERGLWVRKVVDIPENNIKIGVVEVVGVTFFLNEYTDPARKAQAVQGLELPVTIHRIPVPRSTAPPGWNAASSWKSR